MGLVMGPATGPASAVKPASVRAVPVPVAVRRRAGSMPRSRPWSAVARPASTAEAEQAMAWAPGARLRASVRPPARVSAAARVAAQVPASPRASARRSAAPAPVSEAAPRVAARARAWSRASARRSAAPAPASEAAARVAARAPASLRVAARRSAVLEGASRAVVRVAVRESARPRGSAPWSAAPVRAVAPETAAVERVAPRGQVQRVSPARARARLRGSRPAAPAAWRAAAWGRCAAAEHRRRAWDGAPRAAR